MEASAENRPTPFVLAVDYSNAHVLARLPRGRHGLPRDFVNRNHRYRLLGGVIDAATERGYAAMTVSDITRHAAVSRRSFYQHFTDKGDCFLAAYDITTEWLLEAVAATVSPQEPWPRSLALAIERALELLAADPRLARLCTVEVFVAGAAAVDHHDALVERLAEQLRRGREETPDGFLLPLELEQALLGGAVSLIARYVHSGRAGELRELAPVLTELMLTPYSGPGQVRR